MRYCINCGSEVLQGARFCRKCGTSLDDAPGAATVRTTVEGMDPVSTAEIPPPETTENLRPLSSDAEIRRIGATEPLPVGQPTQRPPAPPAASPAGTGRAPMLAGLVLLALAAGGAYLFFHRSAAPTPPRDSAPAASQAAPANPPPLVAPPSTTSPTSDPSAGTIEMPRSSAAAPDTQPRPSPTAKPDAPVASADDHLRLGTAHLGAGRHLEAIAEFQQAQRLAPDNVNLYYLLGTAYQQAGNLQEALAAYRKCTSGDYAAVSRNHVKKLEKKLEKN